MKITTPLKRRLCPTKLREAEAVIPDLGHVTDAVSSKVHHIHVVSGDALPRPGHRAAFARVGAAEDGVRRHIPSILVHGERLQLVGSIRDWTEETLHPLGVTLQRIDLR